MAIAEYVLEPRHQNRHSGHSMPPSASRSIASSTKRVRSHVKQPAAPPRLSGAGAGRRAPGRQAPVTEVGLEVGIVETVEAHG